MAKASSKQRAWRAKFARLYGGKKRRTKSGGKKLAKWRGIRSRVKSYTRSHKQGIFSWVTNVITLGIALAPVIYRVQWTKQVAPVGQRWNFFASSLCGDYTGFEPKLGNYGADNFVASRMLRGWAPMAGAYAFKTAMGMIAKKAPIKSLIPTLG